MRFAHIAMHAPYIRLSLKLTSHVQSLIAVRGDSIYHLKDVLHENYHVSTLMCYVQDTLDQIRIGETLMLRGLKPCGRYTFDVKGN